MKKTFILFVLCVLSVAVTFVSCSEDDDFPKPSFSEITVTPQQDTYHVGDKIKLTIRQTSANPQQIKAAKYWFYYDYATRAMFVTPTADTQEFVSPEITLTAAGDVELSFWAQYDYPQFKYDGVTRYVTIHVVE